MGVRVTVPDLDRDSDVEAIAALETQPFGRSLLTAASAAAGRTLLDAASLTQANDFGGAQTLGGSLAPGNPFLYWRNSANTNEISVYYSDDAYRFLPYPSGSPDATDEFGYDFANTRWFFEQTPYVGSDAVIHAGSTIAPAGGTVGKTLAAWLAVPGVRVSGFTGADATGATSSDAAALAAIAYAKSSGLKKVIFDAGRWLINNGRLLSAESTGGLIMCGEGIDRTTIVHATNTELFYLLGTDTDIGSGVDITVATNIGDNEITITSTTGLTAGQYIILQDPTQTLTSNESGAEVCDVGQMTRIREVVDGTTLRLHGTCLFAYTTSAEVRPLTMVNGFTVEDMTIEWDGTGAPNCISLFQVADINIRRVRFKGQEGDCFRTDDCTNIVVDECKFIDLQNGVGLSPYGINLARGTSNAVITKCFQRGGRHLITNVASTSGIESADVTVSNCIAAETSSAGFDTHQGARNWQFIGNTTIMSGKEDAADRGDGIQIRGRYCYIKGHRSIGCYRGISLFYGERNIAEGCFDWNCRIGVNIVESPYNEIRGHRSIDPIQNGVLIDTNGDAMPGLRLYDFEVKGNPSGAAFETDAWKTSWRARHLVADDASTKFTGFPNASGLPSCEELTGSGDLEMPPGCTSLLVECIGGGGGGGGGARTASGNASSGGGGGGGSSRAVALFRSADLTWPVAYSVGAAGTAGTGATSDGVAGGNGGSGGTTSFGATPYLRAFGGGGGAGGQLAGNSGGGGGAGAFSAGAASTSATGGAAGNTGGVAGGSGAAAGGATAAIGNGGGTGGGGAGTANGAIGNTGGPSSAGCGGGGSGGGVSTGPAAFDGGAGGRATGTYTAATGGTAAGPGAAGGSLPGKHGAGGAGGASNAAGVGGAGGAGGSYGGGGGGGGSAVGGNGGAGGLGGAGLIRVFYFYDN